LCQDVLTRLQAVRNRADYEPAPVSEAHRQRGQAVVSSTSGTIGFTSFTFTSQTVTQGRAFLKDGDREVTS
jgi:hypothetical protein